MPRSGGNYLEWAPTARLLAAPLRIIGDLYSSYLWNKIIHQNQHLHSLTEKKRTTLLYYITFSICEYIWSRDCGNIWFGIPECIPERVKEFFRFENEIVCWLTDLSWYNHQEFSCFSSGAAAGGTAIGLFVFVAGKLAFLILIATDCWGFEICRGPVDGRPLVMLRHCFAPR